MYKDVTIVFLSCMLFISLAFNVKQFIANRCLKKDKLTGLKRKEFIINNLKDAWTHARQSKENLGVLMIDIDFFGAFNNLHGHPAGDVCLAKIASIIKNCVRERSDLVGRYGGEEFTVVLPGVSKTDLAKIAKRIRDAVLEAQIVHGASSVSDYVTVSVGASWGSAVEFDSPESVLKAADDALYQAKKGDEKQSGRNKVRIILRLPKSQNDAQKRKHLEPMLQAS